MKKFLEKLIKKEDLTAEEIEKAVCLMLEDVEPCQVAAFLALLAAKGETSLEVSSLIQSMKNRMNPVSISGNTLDIVGTGGDGMHTVNISTASAFLAAGCGMRIAKHGNRASSSKCGSADVLEELGAHLEMDHETLSKCIEQTGFCFMMFIKMFHPAMEHINPIRKKLQLRTIFNLIGPLLNPASPTHLLVGVYKNSLLKLFAESLASLPIKKALVVHGSGMDELNTVGPCKVLEVYQGGITQIDFDPLDYGFARSTVQDLKGGDAKVNASILKETLAGKKGPIGDTIVLNTGAALYAAERVNSLEDGFEMAKMHFLRGDGLKALERYVDFT